MVCDDKQGTGAILTTWGGAIWRSRCLLMASCMSLCTVQAASTTSVLVCLHVKTRVNASVTMVLLSALMPTILYTMIARGCRGVTCAIRIHRFHFCQDILYDGPDAQLEACVGFEETTDDQLLQALHGGSYEHEGFFHTHLW